jgi:hypothetical protein
MRCMNGVICISRLMVLHEVLRLFVCAITSYIHNCIVFRVCTMVSCVLAIVVCVCTVYNSIVCTIVLRVHVVVLCAIVSCLHNGTVCAILSCVHDGTSAYCVSVSCI